MIRGEASLLTGALLGAAVLSWTLLPVGASGPWSWAAWAGMVGLLLASAALPRPWTWASAGVAGLVLATLELKGSDATSWARGAAVAFGLLLSLESTHLRLRLRRWTEASVTTRDLPLASTAASVIAWSFAALGAVGLCFLSIALLVDGAGHLVIERSLERDAGWMYALSALLLPLLMWFLRSPWTAQAVPANIAAETGVPATETAAAPLEPAEREEIGTTLQAPDLEASPTSQGQGQPGAGRSEGLGPTKSVAATPRL